MFEELQFMAGTEEEEFFPVVSLEDESDLSSMDEEYPEVLPVLALKNTILFPGVIVPITIGRDKSLNAIRKAHKEDKFVAVLSQRDMNIQEPIADDLYRVGTVAKIAKLLNMPDGSTTAILRGRARFELVEMVKESPYLEGKIGVIPFQKPKDPVHFKAQIASIRELATKIIELSPNIPSEAVVMLKNMSSDFFLLNFIASNLNLETSLKQQILEIGDPSQQANRILEQLNSEWQLLEIKHQIDSKVRGDIEKQQRDFFLHQQLKTIQDELGQNPQSQELLELEARAKEKKWPEHVAKSFSKELEKIKRINPQIAEYSVQMNYLEMLLDLPWDEYSEDHFDLKKVKKALDNDHYGLKKVKNRILEHLAVLKLKGDMKAPIICLVGPPGVGKTSLGKSIASALDRKFVRMSLGGLHDESEIRGHRRTYIGAMPGRIIQNLKKAGTSNPVFILDEIDKVGKDFRGDPSSALLEVLDPEQNTNFHDNYLDLDYDLSKVLFIATANTLSTIQPALRDRMEVIEISGYSTEEKVEIAKKHLVPKQRKEHGLKASHISISPRVLRELAVNYTRESGVRALERRIAALMRTRAKEVAMGEEYSKAISVEHLEEILGSARYNNELYSVQKLPGVAVGLAWTAVGGDILFIEANAYSGKGKLTLTGNLGDVMKESATTALSFLKAHTSLLQIDTKWFSTHDIHIHVPEGAIPKDGPSAGVTMLTAMASLIRGKAVKPYLAMSGEITLRGKVLPVGGIKEKVLAAKRLGIRTILLPSDNKRHVEEIETEFVRNVTFYYVESMSEVLQFALD